MLVVHPSSRCDVCLDAYTWESPAHTPHAIPCGHIFCKTCLRAVTPSNCPLCRKAFLPDRAKKLHVDRPENIEEERDLDLLQRLSLAWGENTPVEDLAVLTEEVEAWLRDRPEDSSRPLRKARDALGRYQKLKDKREKDRVTISRLQATLRTASERATQDQDTSKAVEASLLSQVEDLMTKHAKLESEVTALRTELAKYQYTSNPLPRPPEPIPLDRFPAFARATASGSAAASTSNGTSNPNQQPTTNGFDAAEAYKNSYPAYFVEGNFVTPDPGTRAELAAADREATEAREAQEAQERERATKRKQKQPLYSIYRYPTDADANNRQRTGIIPGATPNHRVFPSPTPVPRERHWEERNGSSSNGAGLTLAMGPDDVLDPSAPASAYVSGYASGYGYGFQYAHTQPPGTVFQEPEDLEESVITVNSPTSTLPEQQAPSVRGLGLYGVPPPALPEQSREQERGFGLGLSGVPASAVPANMTNDLSRSHSSSEGRPLNIRRSTVQTDGNVTDSAVSGPSTNRAPAMRTRRRSTQHVAQDHRTARPPVVEESEGSVTGSIRTATERNSMSSWGTPHTRDSGRSMVGSMTELGLTSFPQGAGARTSMTSDISANPYYPFAPRENGATNNEVDGSNTPRASERSSMSSVDPRHTLSVLLGTNPGSSHTIVEERQERPRHLRYSSVPETRVRDIAEQPVVHRANRVNRRRTPPRQFSSSVTTSQHAYTATGAPAAPAQLTDEGYLTEPPAPLTVDIGNNFGNALGLDLTRESESSGPRITAPTPIVSSRGFLRSWSYDNSR